MNTSMPKVEGIGGMYVSVWPAARGGGDWTATDLQDRAPMTRSRPPPRHATLRNVTADRLRNIARQSLATAVAGILATIPMSAVMLVAGATGRMGTQPPRRVVDEAVDGVPGTEASAARDAAATFLHFALGGAMAVGVVPFRAVIRRVVPRPVDELLAGGVFGGSLYALN